MPHPIGKFDSALETYDLIVKQNRTNLWLLFALTQLGNIYVFLVTRMTKRKLYSRESLHDFPNHPLFSHAALQLGNLYFKKKNLAEAISLLFHGSKRKYSWNYSVKPPSDWVRFSIKQGKYEKALTNFETAIQYLKETSLWFFLTQLEIGNLQKKWGKYEEAKKSYRIILDHSKDEEIRKAAKELLDHVDSR